MKGRFVACYLVGHEAATTITYIADCMTEPVITKVVVRDLYVAPSQDGRVILRIGTGEEKPQKPENRFGVVLGLMRNRCVG